MSQPTDAFPQLDVIAVGAHPDDVEVACGGTLALLARQGYRIGIVDLTDGEPTPLCPRPEIRREEAERAREALGVHQRVILNLPNRALMDGLDARIALATEFRKFRPRVVIGFGEKTPQASPDHWQAMQITDAAVFYARLTKWPDRFGGLAEHVIPVYLYFHAGLGTLSPPAAAGRFVVDISTTLDAKLQSIRCYQTQFPPAKQHVFAMVQASAQQIGAAAGFAAGELFLMPRELGTTDMMGLLFGESQRR